MMTRWRDHSDGCPLCGCVAFRWRLVRQAGRFHAVHIYSICRVGNHQPCQLKTEFASEHIRKQYSISVLLLGALGGKGSIRHYAAAVWVNCAEERLGTRIYWHKAALPMLTVSLI